MRTTVGNIVRNPHCIALSMVKTMITHQGSANSSRYGLHIKTMLRTEKISQEEVQGT